MTSIVIRVRRGQPLSERAARQIPFAMSRAINDTITTVQSKQREHLNMAFTLRRRAFVQNTIAIGKDDWAKKTSLVGRVRVGGGQGSQARDGFAAQLARHEQGGLFGVGVDAGFSRNGSASWIPAREGGLRASPASLPARSMRPHALGLWRTDAQRGAGTAGAAARRGKKRTFSIFSKRGELIGIYQRYGLTNKQIRRRVKKGMTVTREERMDTGIKMLWRFEPVVRIKPRLQFFPIAQRIVRSSIAGNFNRNFTAAMRTAR